MPRVSLLPILLFYLIYTTGEVVSDHRKIRIDDDVYCESWRFSVETNDAGYWSTIPARCVQFVQDYMTGDQYRYDSEVVAENSVRFAKTVEISDSGSDGWVFDIDETLLSNLPYYQFHGFGSETFDEESFDSWVDLAEAPALPASLSLYKELKQLGFKIFLLTGRSEYQRNVTEKNLLYAGFTDWERLILRGKLQSSINLKRDQTCNMKVIGFMEVLVTSGVTCWALQWLDDPLNSQIQCIISLNRDCI
ncbi:hypothetical protein RGQ29_011075 [Quercus rubra]|uniref:Acid phosphatase 1 n=1 Tax=Quercus rubra TaxID=3512 RepID=A0AAN7J887_QUERU|nr:hypothetical protein RGQ29_011075 [Quercus rubra]